MGDKLDSTIDAVASMSRNMVFEEKRVERAKHNTKVNTDYSRKRKFEESNFLERPNTLMTEISRSESFGSFNRRPSSSISSQDSEWTDDFKREASSEENDFLCKKAEPRQRLGKKISSSSSHREPSQTESDPMKIWTASDDVALIASVAHVSCLRFVHNSFPFSRNFSYSDIEERFCQLMYDEKLSAMAKKRIDQMPVRQRLHIESRIPFTREEERRLMDLADKVWKPNRKEKSDPENHTVLTIEHFKKILEENRPPFHQSRTAQVLSDHYRRIKGYRDISTASEKYNYESLDFPSDGICMDIDIHIPLQSSRARHHAIARYPLLRSIQSKFQTSAAISDNAVAIIHGKFLQYAMTGKTAIMGRASSYDKVDIDLSKEGPAAKVSRQQALISHLGEDEFSIQNIGQRPIYVDSKPLPQMVSTSLKHGSIIKVASLRLTFSIPVPRDLHPLTLLVAKQARRPQPQQPINQQRGVGLPLPKKPRVKPVNFTASNSGATIQNLISNSESMEKNRMLSAMAGMT
ncbi:Protein CBG08716 [Caenorhabditis briggsae]|uniref:Protein CBG08716 n=3 Tax=Caenorhabditis briggsae TaxID=6238 RepID=A8X783_CAEBR|nr:Protein CBG08716 [Caenorhabditis briggsae]ULU14521.1 hypothetical protein L3Y34_016770 [Caenorhabditis briggsae]CAP28494.1 Protein CBG08716 [Caenorhabditis briggsae]